MCAHIHESRTHTRTLPMTSVAILLLFLTAVVSTSTASSDGDDDDSGDFMKTFFSPAAQAILDTITAWDASCEKPFTDKHMEIQRMLLEHPDARARKTIMQKSARMSLHMRECILSDPRLESSALLQEELDNQTLLDASFFLPAILAGVDKFWSPGAPILTFNDKYNFVKVSKASLCLNVMMQQPSPQEMTLLAAGYGRLTQLLIVRAALFDEKIANHTAQMKTRTSSSSFPSF